ncbi:MAG: DUF805 domain-containing protein [Gammaproteobacteria bacterium]
MNSAAVLPSLDADVAYQTPSLFEVHSRIGRVRYFAYSFATFVPAYCALYLFLTGALALACVALLGALTLNMMLAYRRVRDIGWSGWSVLLAFVPYVNTIYSLLLVALPGQPGVTDSGQPPAPNSPAIVAAAIALPIAAIASVAALAEQIVKLLTM